MEKQNRILVNAALAAENPTFALTGSAGRKWKKMLESYRKEDWKTLVQTISGDKQTGEPDLSAIRAARAALDSYRILVKVDCRVEDPDSEDGPWTVELIPVGRPEFSFSSRRTRSGGFPVSRPFAGEIAKAETTLDGDGVTVQFPILAAEVVLFLGDAGALEETIDEMNDRWRSGIESIQRKTDSGVLDGKEAADEAWTLSKRLKRDLVSWLSDN